MSCVPCDPCSSVSKGDLDRWTSSLKHVLANKTAMDLFEEYLHDCKLDSAEWLEVWKMCDDLLRHVNHHNITKYDRNGSFCVAFEKKNTSFGDVLRPELAVGGGGVMLSD